MNFDGLFSTAANIQRVFASLELVLRGRIDRIEVVRIDAEARR